MKNSIVGFAIVTLTSLISSSVHCAHPLTDNTCCLEEEALSLSSPLFQNHKTEPILGQLLLQYRANHFIDRESQNDMEAALLRYRAESKVTKGFLFHVYLSPSDRAGLQEVAWVSADTPDWQVSFTRFGMEEVWPGLWAIVIPESVAHSPDVRYQFKFALRYEKAAAIQWNTGSYSKIKNGIHWNAVYDLSREDEYYDRQRVTERLHAMRMTPTAGRLLRTLWVEEVLERSYGLRSEIVTFSRQRAIDTYGLAGLELIQQAVAAFVPYRARALRHWNEPSKLFIPPAQDAYLDSKTRMNFIVSYLREIAASALSDTLTPSIRRILLAHLYPIIAAMDKSPEVFHFHERSGPHSWMYVVDRIRTAEELLIEPRRVVLSELKERVRAFYEERRMEIYDLVKDKDMRNPLRRDVFLGRSGISVFGIKFAEKRKVILLRARRAVAGSG